MQENASLRAQVSQADAGRADAEKQLIEMQSRFNEVDYFSLLLFSNDFSLDFHSVVLVNNYSFAVLMK